MVEVAQSTSYLVWVLADHGTADVSVTLAVTSGAAAQTVPTLPCAHAFLSLHLFAHAFSAMPRSHALPMRAR